WRLLQFCDRLFQSMFDLNLLTPQPAHQLHIMVTGDAECCSGGDHVTDDADGIDNMRSAIDQIAEKDRPPSRGAPPALIAPGRALIRQSESFPSGLFEQRSELIGAPVQVSENIERTRLIFLVVPEGNAPDLNFFRSAQDVNVSKPLSLQSSEAAFQIGDLAAHYVRSEVAVRPVTVSLL